MSYTRNYSELGGWRSGKEGGTPITPEALNNMEQGIENASAHAESTSNPHEVTAEQVGAAKSGHTHNYAGSSSAGGAATSANKVNKSLTVKLNGGSTEGTNLFTFNGSAAKSVNITPSAIGAAASSHGNHVPATETASNKKFLRNDNTWATVTPANIGAVPTTRTVNGKALSGNVTLDADDVGALPTTGGTMTGDVYIGSETNTANDDLYIRRVVNDVLKSFRIYWNDSGALQLNAASGGTTFNWLRFNTNNTTLSKELTISSGGTEATTAVGACENLGLMPAMKTSNTYTLREKWKDKVVSVRVSTLGTLPSAKGDKATTITDASGASEIVDYKVLAVSDNITIDITKNCYFNTATGKLVYECPSDMSAYTGVSVIRFT